MPEQMEINHRHSKGLVYAIQGYNEKNNRAKMTAATLAAASIYRGKKNLILQLIDADYEGCENILYGALSKEIGKTNSLKKKASSERTVGDDGMDAIFCLIDKDRMKSSDFEINCIPLAIDKNNNEHRLDIAKVSKNSSFLKQAARKVDEVEFMIKAASSFYDNIFVLLAPDTSDLNIRVNELADKSVYCLTQGNDIKAEKVYGKQIVYIITDYEPSSYFTLNMERKYFCVDSEKMFKISHNVPYMDAVKKAKLFQFVLDNHAVEEDDINYICMKDIEEILDFMVSDTVKEQEFNLLKLFSKEQEKRQIGTALQGHPDTSYLFEEKQSFFSRLFGRKKKMIGIPDKSSYENDDFDYIDENEENFIDTDYIEKQVDERRTILATEEEQPEQEWGETVNFDEITAQETEEKEISEDNEAEIVQFSGEEKIEQPTEEPEPRIHKSVPETVVENAWDIKEVNVEEKSDDGVDNAWSIPQEKPTPKKSTSKKKTTSSATTKKKTTKKAETDTTKKKKEENVLEASERHTEQGNVTEPKKTTTKGKTVSTKSASAKKTASKSTTTKTTKATASSTKAAATKSTTKAKTAAANGASDKKEAVKSTQKKAKKEALAEEMNEE